MMESDYYMGFKWAVEQSFTSLVRDFHRLLKLPNVTTARFQKQMSLEMESESTSFFWLEPKNGTASSHHAWMHRKVWRATHTSQRKVSKN